MTVPYNPQQNEVVERKNRSIFEVAKAMIHDKKLSMFICGEATNTIVYVQKKSPHQAFGDKTPK